MARLIYFTLFIFITYPLLIAQAGELNNNEKIYFNVFDLNKDNFISFDEINQSLKSIFQLLDYNLDGKISKEEIIELKKFIESLS